jgi:hypothetical protein
MSKVAIQGNASGTGTFTIASPNSNTDRTLTLPDEAGTVLTSGTDVANFPSGFANGITGYDQWRLNSSYSRTNNQVIDSYWERNDSYHSQIGSGMSQSNGIFSFPETGIWLVIGKSLTYSEGGNANYIGHKLEVSGNGGVSYAYRAIGYGDARDTGAYQDVTTIMTMDLPNTSDYRIRMVAATGVTTAFLGNTSANQTCLTFIRLGDT